MGQLWGWGGSYRSGVAVMGQLWGCGGGRGGGSPSQPPNPLFSPPKIHPFSPHIPPSEPLYFGGGHKPHFGVPPPFIPSLLLPPYLGVPHCRVTPPPPHFQAPPPPRRIFGGPPSIFGVPPHFWLSSPPFEPPPYYNPPPNWAPPISSPLPHHMGILRGSPLHFCPPPLPFGGFLPISGGPPSIFGVPPPHQTNSRCRGGATP